MKRENRYLVIKREDIETYLPGEMRDQLTKIIEELSHAKSYCEGRDKLTEYVVVADDWPMYEATWEAIEKWVASQQSMKENEC